LYLPFLELFEEEVHVKSVTGVDLEQLSNEPPPKEIVHM
jgi:hypothetical protein